MNIEACRKCGYRHSTDECPPWAIEKGNPFAVPVLPTPSAAPAEPSKQLRKAAEALYDAGFDTGCYLEHDISFDVAEDKRDAIENFLALAAAPASVAAEPVAWAATSEDGRVEALGMNQSRRFDTPLYFAATSPDTAPQTDNGEPSQQPAKAVQELPEPAMHVTLPGGGQVTYYTLDQVRALLALRAAPVAEQPIAKIHSDGYWTRMNGWKEPLNFHSVEVYAAAQPPVAEVASKEADVRRLRELLAEVRPYVADAPRDPYGDFRPESIDHELLSAIDAALSGAKP